MFTKWLQKKIKIKVNFPQKENFTTLHTQRETRILIGQLLYTPLAFPIGINFENINHPYTHMNFENLCFHTKHHINDEKLLRTYTHLYGENHNGVNSYAFLSILKTYMWFLLIHHRNVILPPRENYVF